MLKSSVSRSPVIVGAGPVGLAAALFLARRGFTPRVFEATVKRDNYSKALAINPRTLEIFAASRARTPEGLDLLAEVLAQGIPVRQIVVRAGGKERAVLPLAGLHPEFPYMLALSQACTEALLESALLREGVRVERGQRLSSCVPAGGAGWTLRFGAAADPVHADLVLGADGAHSAVRKSQSIAFEGDAFAEDWHLWDLPLEGNLDPHSAYVDLGSANEGGFTFLIRVVDPRAAALAAGNPLGAVPPSWRILSTHARALEKLQLARPAGPITWQSHFRVSHRVARHFVKQGPGGTLCLAGDAAHIHSPAGARGMNLGIQDAWVFAELAQRGELARYAERRELDRRVVERIKNVSRMVASRHAGLARVRPWAVSAVAHIPAVRRRLLRTMTGLDLPTSLLGERP